MHDKYKNNMQHSVKDNRARITISDDTLIYRIDDRTRINASDDKLDR